MTGIIDIEKFMISLRLNRYADGRLNPIHLADTLQEEMKIVEEAIKHSQRPWVSLTPEQAKEISLANRPYVIDMVYALDAKLKELNT